MADFSAFAAYSFTAPKADALPGCATPRHPQALRFPGFRRQAEMAFVAERGRTWREQVRDVPEYPMTTLLTGES